MPEPPDITDGTGEITPATGVTLDNAGVLRESQEEASSLGRYVVLSTLGKGGMGTVYRAYDPKLQREVALKQLRRREDEQVRARVLREARAMARLSHPNVVAVYDVDESLEPPLVAMEYVPGITLRRWLQKVRPWREIVDVFEKIGRGLHAAHLAKLVHRDFKPSNVLVTSLEDGPQRRERRVLVADFGLARQIDKNAGAERYASGDQSGAVLASSGESVESTRISGVQGTPRYMAPEQHDGVEPDARADQYAYCLSAWEALSGKYPFPRGADARAAAKHDGPPKWTGALHVPRSVVAALRRGLEPDPENRWPSVEPLVAVMARYSQRRRRPILVWAGSTAIATLGVVGYAWWAETSDVCSGAEDELSQTWNQAERERLADAFERLDASFAVRTWSETEASLDRFGAEWTQTHSRTCEAAGLGKIDDEALDLQMMCLRRARETMGSTIEVLGGMNAEGASLAHEVVNRLPPVADCTNLDALKERRWSIPPELEGAVDETRSDLERARSLQAAGRIKEAGQLARDASNRATELGFAPLRAEALLTYGELYREPQGRQDAQQALLASVELALEHDMKEVAVHGSNILIREYAGPTPRFALAERISELALAMAQGHFLGTSTHARTLDSIAFLRAAQGRFSEALDLSLASYELQSKIHGPDDLRTAKALNNLGLRYDDVEKFDEALGAFRQALAIKEAKLGDQHPVLTTTLMNLGNLARVQSRFDDATARYQAALTIAQDVHGPNHPEVATLIDNMGIVFYERREYEQALAHFERALGIMEMAGQPDAPAAYRYRVHIASTSRHLGDYDRAITLSLECLSYFRQTLGPQHQRTTGLLNNLGNAYRTAGRLDEAEEVLRESFRIRLATQGPRHPAVLQSRRNLGTLLFARGRSEDALRMLTTALMGYRELESRLHIDEAEVLRERGEMRLATGQAQAALTDAREGLAALDGRQAAAGLRAELYGLAARSAAERGDTEAARSSVADALKILEDPSVDFGADERAALEELSRELAG